MKRFKPVDLSQVAQTRRDVLSISFSELLELYCQSRPAKRPEIREYRLRKWRAQFRHLPAWKVTAAHVNAMVTAMEAQGYAAPTINRDVADIASCYAWAIKRRYCPVDFQSSTREFQRRPDAPWPGCFRSYYRELEEGPLVGQVYNYLLGYDLSNFSYDQLPVRTPALLRLCEESAPDFHKRVKEMYESRSFPFDDPTISFDRLRTILHEQRFTGFGYSGL